MATTRINTQLENEIDALLRRLYRISGYAKKESQAAFKKAAPILINAIQAGAPEADYEHFRYKDGKPVAIYDPGNLKRSIRVLIFSRSDAVFVGPKVDKGGSGGTFSGSRVDGFYAHWMEYGAPEAGIRPRAFVWPAVNAIGARTLQVAIQELKKKIFGP